MSEQNETLPCLNSVAPWWTEPDRQMLFCYLLKIFPFEAGYLAALPASTYIENGSLQKIKAKDIEKECIAFCETNKNTKYSCAGIRRINFSFGKLNPHICFLCPYSSTYKNKLSNEEHRMLYYMLQASSHTLKDFLTESKNTSENIFRSYFPVYVKNILIDAFPFSMIAKNFEDTPENKYCDDTRSFTSEMLQRLNTAADQKIKYQRDKEQYIQLDPCYYETVHSCMEAEFRAIENIQPEIAVINMMIVKRLFRVLSSASAKYSPKKPEQFNYEGKNLIAPKLFESTPFESKTKESEKEYQDSLSKESVKMEESTSLENFEDAYFKNLPSIDSLEENTSEHMSEVMIAIASKPYIQETPKALKDTGNSKKAFSTCKAKSDHVPGKKTYDNKSLLPEYPDFYHITNSASFFRSEDNDETTQALIFALTSESAFFCMEPTVCNNIEGLLVMNSEKDFFFYPLELYGPRFLRAVSNQTPIYTCSTYALSRYLHRNKVWGLALFDIAVAKSIEAPSKAFDMKTIFGSYSIEKNMPLYPDIYHKSLKNMTENQRRQVRQYEQFIPLLSSNGYKPPFENMKQLYSQINSLYYMYLYQSESPTQSGVFLHMNVSFKNYMFEKNKWIELYMDTCINYNKYIPFYEGHVFLLNLDEYGILLFATGNEYNLQEARLFLKSCTRRIFQKEVPASETIKFELQYNIYDLKSSISR